jgi:hypothetical protein
MLPEAVDKLGALHAAEAGSPGRAQVIPVSAQKHNEHTLQNRPILQ